MFVEKYSLTVPGMSVLIIHRSIRIVNTFSENFSKNFFRETQRKSPNDFSWGVFFTRS